MTKAFGLTTLIARLDSLHESASTPPPISNEKLSRTTPNELQEVEPIYPEYLGWGPKTADPGPDKNYPFRETPQSH
jgi:hypothetical protein